MQIGFGITNKKPETQENATTQNVLASRLDMNQQYFFMRNVNRDDNYYFMGVEEEESEKSVNSPSEYGIPLEQVSYTISIAEPGGRRLVDAHRVVANQGWIFSNEVASLLKEFRVEDEARFLPIKVFNNKRKLLDERVFFATTVRWMTLDENSSDCLYSKKVPGYIKKVVRWATDWNKVPDLDIFFDHLGKWVVSKNLAKRLQEESVTGLTFEPMP